jgi:hypothetical protein
VPSWLGGFGLSNPSFAHQEGVFAHPAPNRKAGYCKAWVKTHACASSYREAHRRYRCCKVRIREARWVGVGDGVGDSGAVKMNRRLELGVGRGQRFGVARAVAPAGWL